MNFAVSNTRSALGINAQAVSVEVHLSNGLPCFTIVGLAETAVKESRDRVRSAIINSQYEFPCRKITINLAPADLPKSGSGFDLPIAIGILAASNQIPADKLNIYEFIGELALNGELRRVPGIVPIVIAARRANKSLIIANANAEEAAITGHLNVYAASSLREVCNFLTHHTPLASLPPQPAFNQQESKLDWSEIKGQQHAKQAMIIAATGGHSLLLSGPPGSGKTMLAKRFTTLLPELTENQALECAAINSIRGKLPDYNQWRQPPFRAPHHTASPVAIAGGGSPPKPGEISLAHHGVLFLDELPEFSKYVLETLREPLEAGNISISRAAMQIDFPAKFQLLAAMNPCPCGQWGNPEKDCLCTPDRIKRYLAKLSAPLLDRIDMHVQVKALPHHELIKQTTIERESDKIRMQVAKIRHLQITRQGSLNAELSANECETVCQLSAHEQTFLMQALDKLKLSARAYHRLLKVARTIADLKEEKQVGLSALKQALTFKQTLQMPN